MCKKQIAEIRKARNILVSYTVIGYGSYSNSMVVANWLYTVSQKNKKHKLLPITSPNINRFSNFYH